MNIFIIALMLFVAGSLENGINSWLMRASAHGKTLQAFISGTLYVLVWMVALKSIVENINTVWLVLPYAFGSGCGSAILVWWSKTHQEKNETTSKNLVDTSRKLRV